MSLSAYRSSLGTSSVTDSAISIVNTSGTSSTTPAVAVSDENSWVVSYWSEKSSTDGIIFTLPGDVTQRGAAAGTGSGKTSGVVADSNGPVAIGTSAGKVATVNPAISRSVTYSVVVSPGVVADPLPNQAPDAVFTVDCVGLACTANAGGSSDPDGDALTYNWNWGDGTPDTAGVNGSHTYATAGTRTVTLTVSDGELQDSTTRDAVTTAPPSNQAPDAVFTIDCVDLACTANASGSSDPNGDALTYNWNWGDGTPDTAGVNGSHTYATAGTRQRDADRERRPAPGLRDPECRDHGSQPGPRRGVHHRLCGPCVHHQRQRLLRSRQRPADLHLELGRRHPRHGRCERRSHLRHGGDPHHDADRQRRRAPGLHDPECRDHGSARRWASSAWSASTTPPATAATTAPRSPRPSCPATPWCSS